MSIDTKVGSFESEARTKTMVGVALVSVLLLTPFTVSHIFKHSYIIGFGSVAVLFLLVLNGWLCARGRYYPTMILVGLVPAIIAFLFLAFRQQGIIAALWCYPAVISFYFMLPERQAWLANALLLSMALPCSVYYLELFLASRVIATLLCVSIFAVIFLRIITMQQQQLSQLAMTDALTGLANRVMLPHELEHAVLHHDRNEMPACLISLDLDHFKAINDELGHAAGDKVLKGVGQLLKERVRRSDRVFRLGGEEFLIVLYETNLKQAAQIAESLRFEIESHPFLPNRKVTTSAGVAIYQKDEHWRDWLKRSDDNLYLAKKAGRNRVISEGEKVE